VGWAERPVLDGHGYLRVDLLVLCCAFYLLLFFLHFACVGWHKEVRVPAACKQGGINNMKLLPEEVYERGSFVVDFRTPT
jgi:hypothetical protein